MDKTLTMTVAHDNTTLEGVFGTVIFNTWAHANSPLLVPGPGVLSMALAGLLVLGGARLRARSRLRA
ncbi:hypothetical protein [Pseudoduganella umbonata]|uniref:Uncharacterized protein n=1 Tax=Pseudoduganella umbonata TaxID=864828 RepID=A0A7W5HC54_9BURK|nr:hypothetical protein [Pseudoduganella umbonata]MBB3221304.1 hypothetical protein [Pseudoduganella umbonata]